MELGPIFPTGSDAPELSSCLLGFMAHRGLPNRTDWLESAACSTFDSGDVTSSSAHEVRLVLTLKGSCCQSDHNKEAILGPDCRS